MALVGKYLKIYLYSCLAIITIGFIYFGYLYFIDGVYANVPLTFDTTEVTTQQNVYTQGDSIVIKWKYCKGTNKESRISVNMIDGVIWFLPEIKSTRGIGCYDDFIVVAKVPHSLPAGVYHLEGIIHFDVNSVKSIDYVVISNNFEIK